MKLTVTILVFALVCWPASAATIHVPADQPTIQAGIDAALDGDTVLVADGTYTGTGNRDIDFSGKAITVRSENGPASCVVDCELSGLGFQFNSGEGPDSVLQGLTIRKGYAPDDWSGGILCEFTSPTITGMVIEDCQGSVVGGIACIDCPWVTITNTIIDGCTGGIYGARSGVMISGCTITDNMSYPGGWAEGGGIRAVECSLEISDNTISGNIVRGSGGGLLIEDSSCAITGNIITSNLSEETHGGGIGFYDSSGTITGNTIAGNQCYYSGGGIICGGSNPVIADNWISANHAGSRGGGICCGGASPTIENNLIMDNRAETGGGISSAGEDAVPLVNSNTIIDNTADYQGGGIHIQSLGSVDVTSSILWGNVAPYGGEIYVGTSAIHSSISISFCDVEGGQDEVFVAEGCTLEWGPGMIEAAPLFLFGPLGDHYLSQAAAGQPGTSPCVDAGDPGGPLIVATTRTDSVADQGVPDMGYHHTLTTGTYICFQPASLAFASLYLEDPPPNQTVQIYRGGSGMLEWSASTGVSWLELSPASGVSQGEFDDVTVSVDPQGLEPGEHQAVITILGVGAANSPQEIPVSFSLGFTPQPRLVAGPGPSYDYPPVVRVFPPLEGAAHIHEFSAYGVPHYGVNVAVGDVTGDLVDEILTGAGPAPVFGPHVRGFQVDGTPLPGLSFLAYGTNRFGVNVAAADLDGDGNDEILTGAGPGAVFGPHIRAFDYSDGGPKVTPVPGVNFFAYGTNKWGVNVAGGDIDGDGTDEIVTGAGPGAVFGPHVRGWNVDGGPAAAMPDVSYFAYASQHWGVVVTCGDLDGDGIDEIVTAPGPSSLFGAHVRGWDYDGAAVAPLPGCNFLAWPVTTRLYGGRVHAGADLDGDGRDELVVGAGPDPGVGLPPVQVYDYDDGQVSLFFTLEAFPSGWTHGVNVAAGLFYQ